MVMAPPVDNADAVANAKVVIPVVVLCATLSPTASVRLVSLIMDPSLGRYVPQSELLATSFDVEIEMHLNDENGIPIFNCPATNIIW